MLAEIVKEELGRIVGPENASFSKEDLVCYSYDATNSVHMPDAVIFPRSAREISLIMKMANAENFYIVPRGAGTGFTGGSVPVAGGVVLSLERMREVIEIDEKNRTAVVEPGVNTWEFQQEVEKRGLFYPPDPTSLKFSTIGGNIAECAGGPRAVKYGVTRDYVLGLEVVLPTGEVIDTGTATTKGVVGYDLTRLMVGSEGTLGIVTKAILKLIPKPESVRTVLAFFPDVATAAAVVSEIIASGTVPSTLEIMDSFSIKAVSDYAGGLPEAGAMLLIEVDGRKEAAVADEKVVLEIAKRGGATGVRSAFEKKEVKDLWKARRAISASLFKIKPFKINEDVVVPPSRIPALVEGLGKIGRKKGLVIASFGHAGDGNIHVNIMHDESEKTAAEEAVGDVFELALGLGGTISGEHGVGMTKSGYIGMELGPGAIRVMKAIKRVFDPQGILNPGKIFPPEEKKDERVGIL